MPEKIGLIGLGVIGHEIALHLIAKPYEVYGFRRSSMAVFEQAGGITAANPREIAEACSVIFTVLPDAKALKEVISGPDGLLTAGRKGLTIVDLSTLRLSEKEAARDILEQAGCSMLDAPLSGIPKMVAERTAVIFVSGEEQAYQRAKPALEAFSDKVFYLGEFGVGTKMKFVANALVGIHVVATAEAIALGLKAGLDKKLLVDVLSPSAASSLQFQVRAPMMVDSQFEPALAASSILDKDLDAIVEFAEDLNCPTLLTHTAHDYFKRTRNTELAKKDCASVFELLAAECDLKT